MRTVQAGHGIRMVILPWPVIVAASLALALGCRQGRRQATQADWTRWFEGEATALERWKAPDGDPGGHAERSADGLSVIVPPKYKRRNAYGCWDSHRRAEGGEERSICLQRLTPGSYTRPGFFWGRPGLVSDTDGERRYESWQAGAVNLQGRRAIVERCIVSGGVEGASHRRDTLVLVELARGSWAILEGNATDDGGYEEFLQIASTIRSIP
jgi:hypothetical protein